MYCRIYIEEVQLIRLDTDAVGEKQNIALLPRHLLGRELVTSSGGSHCDYTEATDIRRFKSAKDRYVEKKRKRGERES